MTHATRSLDQLILRCGPDEPSVCEACGGEFECGAGSSGASCWCAEISLSEALRAELRARYERCLCRACLEKLAHRAASDEPTVEPEQGGLELGTSR